MDDIKKVSITTAFRRLEKHGGWMGLCLCGRHRVDLMFEIKPQHDEWTAKYGGLAYNEKQEPEGQHVH